MNENLKHEIVESDDSHEVITNTDAIDFVEGLLLSKRTYCSIKAETQAQKAQVANAMNNPTHRISDCINTVIMVKDVYLETLKMRKKDEKGVEFGEPYNVPRLVLFDEKGESYQAVSVGLYSAVQKIMQIYGLPTWEEPIPVKIKQVTRGERKMLTLEVVSVKK